MAEVFVFWFAIAFLCGLIAIAKNRSVGWFFLGLLFSVFALVLLLALPALGARARRERTCPECAEAVLVEARRCKHCGASIVPENPEPDPAITEVDPAHTAKLRRIRRHFGA